MSIARLRIPGAKKLRVVLDPKRMDPIMKKHLMRANKRIGLNAVDHIRKVIDSRTLAKNAKLTIALKGSSKPLVDNADLYNSINYKILSAKTVFVGVLRTEKVYNIAATLHTGAEIPVTPAMRSMFFRLWLVSIGKASRGTLTGRAAELYEMFQNWKPLKDDTSVIIIPARPFADKALRSVKLRKLVRKIWEQAISDGLREQAA